MGESVEDRLSGISKLAEDTKKEREKDLAEKTLPQPAQPVKTLSEKFKKEPSSESPKRPGKVLSDYS